MIIFLCGCMICLSWLSGVADAADLSKCEIYKGPCMKKIDGTEMIFEITPRPVRAMEELRFSISVSGESPENILILELAMPGMFMGINKVVLKKAADGRYYGTGIIPRCPSGKNLWSASVKLPRKGKVEFFFDVVY